MARSIHTAVLASAIGTLLVFAGGCKITNTTTTTNTEPVAGEPTATSNEVMAKLKTLTGN